MVHQRIISTKKSLIMNEKRNRSTREYDVGCSIILVKEREKVSWAVTICITDLLPDVKLNSRADLFIDRIAHTAADLSSDSLSDHSSANIFTLPFLKLSNRHVSLAWLVTTHFALSTEILLFVFTSFTPWAMSFNSPAERVQKYGENEENH